MPTTQAILSAAEFARDPVHDAAIDRAIAAGRGLYGTDFYVVCLADLGNGNRIAREAHALGIQRADGDGAQAYVGAVDAAEFTRTLVAEDGTDTIPDFPDADGTGLVVAIRDEVAVAFVHETIAQRGRADRETQAAYEAAVAARVIDAASDPVTMPATEETDYGSDVSTFVVNPDGRLDLDPTFTIIAGTQVVAEALARRLSTRRGSLPYDPDFGLDLRDWLLLGVNATGTQARVGPSLFALRTAVEGECAKDERVESASADVTYDRTNESLSVRVRVTLLTGVTFRLVLSIDAVTAAVLKVTT